MMPKFPEGRDFSQLPKWMREYVSRLEDECTSAIRDRDEMLQLIERKHPDADTFLMELGTRNWDYIPLGKEVSILFQKGTTQREGKKIGRWGIRIMKNQGKVKIMSDQPLKIEMEASNSFSIDYANQDRNS